MALLIRDRYKLIYRYNNETVCIEPWGENSARVRSVMTEKFPEENWALDEITKECIPEIKLSENGAEFKNGKLKVVISRYGKISVYNQNDKLLLEEFARTHKDVTDPKYSALEVEAREFKPIIGGDFKIKVRFDCVDENEKLYGMGQYQQPFLNLKGADIELAQRNSQASVPFVVSSMGYGFLWNNPSVGRAVFGKNLTTWETSSSKCIDYWITVGDTPAEIEESYAAVTGYVPMMPDYAMGFWQCKLRYQTQEELLSVAREYKRRGLPISVIVIDYFHWPYQGDWRFDEEFWPDVDAMISELKEMGIELMVSIWPQVDRKSENYAEMLEEGLLTQTELGIKTSFGFMGETISCDVTNERARCYLWDKIKKNYYDKGIKLFWLDQAEPEMAPYDFENIRYSMGTCLSVGNIYPRMYAKTFFDGMKNEGQKNIISLIRCAWAGSQKYGSLVWSGDVHSTFESFRNQFAAGLNMGIAGIPWWTTDIGGFDGGNPDDEDFRELLIRWFQYGTFCPVMRLHGDREPRQKPISMERGGPCASGADNEVWSFGEKAYEILKVYMNIRERLFDYIKNAMRQAHENGTPVMRTLFYSFPDDNEAWETEDEYMFGDDILVAPIMYPKMTERNIYLPLGTKWIDVWSMEVIDGGKHITLPVTMDKIPIFVKAENKLLAELISTTE